MLTIFNRQELVITMDMKRQADVCKILSQNEIKYTVKTTNLLSYTAIGSCIGRTGSFRIQRDYSYEYKIYVHKKDYERAKWLIC
ncbi:hypothetical protein ACQRBH_16180 [Bariatricus sp. SGI.161]|uniref:hypothetical protein n=1 Tax=Bariatricus sp. SGI.161 TaxID=3420550 RepID=UPI003CFC4991